jgi:prevent-host-death family protein
MQTVTPNDLQTSLPELLQRVQTEPIVIRDAGKNVAVLISAKDYDHDRLLKVEAFERSRDAMALELERGLAQNGLHIEDFVRDLLR